MKKIIVINGVATAGKDTFVELFIKHSACSVFEWSSIQTVKDIATCTMGWDGAKDERGRRLLADLKAAWTRYNNGPFKEIVERIFHYSGRYDDFVFFVHVREPEEIQKIKDSFPKGMVDGVTTMLIDKPALVPPGNDADQNVRNFNYDIHIDNSTTLESLEFAAKQLARVFTVLKMYPDVGCHG